MVLSGIHQFSPSTTQKQTTSRNAPADGALRNSNTSQQLVITDRKAHQQQSSHIIKRVRISDPEIFRLNPNHPESSQNIKTAVNSYLSVAQFSQTEALSNLLGIDVKV